MNKIALVGRLTKDPELKFTPGKGTAVANFTVAVDRDGLKDQIGNKLTDFLPVNVWGKQAENTANFCSKGDLIGIEGRVQTRKYQAQDGTNRYVTEVNASRVEFFPNNRSKAQSQNAQNAQNQSYGNGMPQPNQQQTPPPSAYGSSDYPDNGFSPMPSDDDEIPF
ncbi:MULTISPECIES: single-stranded DNA-binding protein [Clostridium]|jgi:single-strand DNA-binding protein|uniref:single-stranded DNA-binding protein n=1 Tax=Clostridium TaxID=1485 RepID=UPI0024322F3C|nr:single-stranded DNA-binding protein [Clostridium tyrobutyricum]